MTSTTSILGRADTSACSSSNSGYGDDFSAPYISHLGSHGGDKLFGLTTSNNVDGSGPGVMPMVFWVENDEESGEISNDSEDLQIKLLDSEDFRSSS